MQLAQWARARRQVFPDTRPPGLPTPLSVRPHRLFSMRTIRRVTAFVIGLLVFQLTLATSGYACVAQDVASHGGMAMGDETAQVSDLAPQSPDDAACDAVPPGGPCGSTDTEGDCDAMGMCAQFVLTADRVASSSPLLRSELVTTQPRALLTRATAPELPPPRT